MSEGSLKSVYPNCYRILGDVIWGRICASLDIGGNLQLFVEQLAAQKEQLEIVDYLPDLAHIEWALHTLNDGSHIFPEVDEFTVNPTVSVVPVSYNNLISLLPEYYSCTNCEITPADCSYILLWCAPQNGQIIIKEADDSDLLALKIVFEERGVENTARNGDVPIGEVEAILWQAVDRGILLAPKSRIQRKYQVEDKNNCVPEEFVIANTFTLQWHITQVCDLHCKHCYDRSERDVLPLEQALVILQDFHDFCCSMNVRGQVTFTGGNPLLYPHFLDVYQAASDFGFTLAILGNPSPSQKIDELLEIRKPAFFQVSLEGMEKHNDQIRGANHFQRTLSFLKELNQREIYSMVMLTLTRANLDQVIPLASILKDRVDSFNFNRLSTVGEGAQLLMVQEKNYQCFLQEYIAESERNPILGMKDNLFNIIKENNGNELIGGCTGYGCGAAFNFVSLLPDGEVHACRKFPSYIGNVYDSSLLDIYNSTLAEQYRQGAASCTDCHINHVCRGCLAIAHSYGLDVFKEKDPFCFLELEREASHSLPE